MRPVSRPGGPPDAWQAPAQLKFGPGVMTRVFGPKPPPTVVCLNLLERKLVGPGLSDEELAAAGLIEKRLPAVYKRATGRLLKAFGSYCSYCELRLGDAPQLEHVVPQSPYPTFALTWDNFLLACIGCNSRKHDHPLRATVEASHLGPPPWIPADYYQAIRTKAYRWPDLDPTHGYFAVRLFRNTKNGWRRVQDWASVRAVRTQRARVIEGDVLARLPNLGDQSVAAIVVEATDRADARTAATIKLCALDRWPVPGEYADRRTLFRTDAWFDAVEALAPLAGTPAPAVSQADVKTVISSGFFWTWLSVAELLSPLVLKAFVNASANQFPGTDKARLPP